MSEWTRKMPSEPGKYWMRDSSGGPTLYFVEMVDGELVYGNRPNGWRIPVGEGMLKCCEWCKDDNA